MCLPERAGRAVGDEEVVAARMVVAVGIVLDLLMDATIHTLTVNASHDARQCITGIGIVIQERQGVGKRGPIIAEISEVHHDVHGSAELLAILRAFEIGVERGYSRMNVRSDCNALRTRLKKLHHYGKPAPDPVRAHILELTQRFILVRFGYVPRRKNQIARRLARTARLADPAYLTLTPSENERAYDFDEDYAESDETSWDEGDDEIPF